MNLFIYETKSKLIIYDIFSKFRIKLIEYSNKKLYFK